MKRKNIYVLRGIGIGFILTASIFFAFRGNVNNQDHSQPDKEEIMKMASELGMVKVTSLDGAYLTDDQVIEKAKTLGMDFIDSK